MQWMLAQLNPIIGDIEGNKKKILETLELARARSVEAIVFPELVLCGYAPEDLVLHQDFIEAQRVAIDEIAAATHGLVALVGFTRRIDRPGEKPLFNSVAVIEDGKILGYVDKQLLPTYDVFDERRYFSRGAPAKLWTLRGQKVGILICEDMWQHANCLKDIHYPVDPVMQLKELGPDIAINISASPYHASKPEMRIRSIGGSAAKTLGVPLLYCCQVGGNDQIVFDGYSFCLDGHGELKVLAQGFEEDFVSFDPEHLGEVVSMPVHSNKDLFAALVLGVRDYLHKLGLKTACLGLSGGIDSALVAAIAKEALGAENVLGVLMPSGYTSQESIDDAKKLAANLEIKLIDVSIEKTFRDLEGVLTPLFDGRAVDVTEENIQARIRGLILMAISNKLGHIVLSTGNKSEMGMGYCTLYGDMCGGLSVISDLTKRQVHELCSWCNQEKEIIPKRILEKEPSAELRAGQRDRDTLPCYDVVDQVVTSYVEQFLSPEEIAEKTGVDLEIVHSLILKIHQAEYKRRQAAPGIRVSKKAFRVGRFYPIVQKWVY